jgi:putative membrane protein
MSKFWVVGAAIVVAAMNVPAAESVDSRSADFIRESIQGHLFEMKAGELAKSKGAKESVRNFGAMLAKDHGAASVKSMAAAKALGVTPPTAPSQTQQGLLEAMGRLEGDKFDEQFIKSMIDDHLRDIARYDAYSKGQDAAAKYAAATLPTLRDHLKAAQGLENERATR